MRRILISTVLVLSFGLILQGCSSSTTPAGTLLAEVIMEYGGEDNVKKLDSFVQVWDMDSPARGTKGVDTRYLRLPNHLRVELKYPDKSETRIVSGMDGFKIYNGGEAEPARGPRLKSMMIQLMRLYSPLTLLKKQGKIELIEEGDYKVLKLDEDGLVSLYYVNSKTKRIDLVVGQLQMQGRTMEFKTEYHDFRKVDGVLVPHREVKYAMGMNTANNTLRGMEFKVVDAAVFKAR